MVKMPATMSLWSRIAVGEIIIIIIIIIVIIIIVIIIIIRIAVGEIIGKITSEQDF